MVANSVRIDEYLHTLSVGTKFTAQEVLAAVRIMFPEDKITEGSVSGFLFKAVQREALLKVASKKGTNKKARPLIVYELFDKDTLKSRNQKSTGSQKGREIHRQPAPITSHLPSLDDPTPKGIVTGRVPSSDPPLSNRPRAPLTAEEVLTKDIVVAVTKYSEAKSRSIESYSDSDLIEELHRRHPKKKV